MTTERDGCQQERLRELFDALSAITTISSSLLPAQDIKQRVMIAAAQALRCESAQIVLLEDERWVVRYIHNLPEEVVGASFSQEELSHATLVFLTRRPVAIGDAFNDKRTNPLIMRRHDIRSVLGLPVIVREQVIGVLFFNHHSRQVEFSDLEIDFALKVSISISLALQNTQLYAELKGATDDLQEAKALSDALNRINDLVHATFDPDQIMQTVLLESTRTIGAESAMLFMKEGTDWVVRSVYRLSTALVGLRFTDQEAKHTAITASTKAPLVVTDAYADRRVDPTFVRMLEIRSLLDFPLMNKEAVVGDLVFHFHSRPTPFREIHIDFVRKLGISISYALQNARLFTALGESEELFRALFEQASVGIAVLDMEGHFIRGNHRLGQIIGYDEQDLQQLTFASITHPQDLPQELPLLDRLLGGEIPSYTTEKRYIHRQGHLIWVRVTSSLAHMKSPYRIAVIEDIEEQKQAQERLLATQESCSHQLAELNAIVDQMTEGLVVFDTEGNLLDMNPPALRMHGFKSVEALQKNVQQLNDIFQLHDLDGRALSLEQWPISRVLRGETIESYEVQVGVTGGAETWIASFGGAPVRDRSGKQILSIVTMRDITEQKRLEAEVRHMAYHDALTKLPNRRLFMDIINLEVAEARRNDKRLALLFLDLDRFKEVNDTLGHEVGDKLLVEVARRLRASVRESDVVARLGGDEFTILLSDIQRAEHVTAVIQKILDFFGESFHLAGHDLHVSTSIGISIYPEDSTEVETLFRFADIAMYHAKEIGRNNYQFYNPEINVRSLERMKFENILRQTITRGELAVYYQPQVDTSSRRIICAEALVRWQHPEMGLLEPGQFISVAEESGFITAIDDWVLKTVCTQFRAWLDAGLQHPFCITVNLSARQFQRTELAASVARVLRETGMPADRLDLEITETTAMRNVERTAQHLKELAQMGVHISIDDFGTGYSSLNYLKRLPIQRLKIDKSFVQDVATDPDDRIIIQAVTAMAHNMNLKVVAEGVETEDQVEFLKMTGCDAMQGYLFSRPLPREEFSTLILGESQMHIG